MAKEKTLAQKTIQTTDHEGHDRKTKTDSWNNCDNKNYDDDNNHNDDDNNYHYNDDDNNYHYNDDDNYHNAPTFHSQTDDPVDAPF